MDKLLLLVNMLLQATTAANEIASLLKKVQAEGRDPTKEEMDALRAGDDASRKRLQDLIDGTAA